MARSNSRAEKARGMAACAIGVGSGGGDMAVVPPKVLRVPGMVWFLEKAMYGTRTASRLFGSYVIDSMEDGGFRAIGWMPMAFSHPDLDVTCGVHGDDFLAEGIKESLDALDVMMKKYFEVKVMPRIGPPEFGGEVSSGEHLKCTISWTAEGFTWAGNTKHVLDLMQIMGLTEETRGVDTPSSKDTGKGVRTALDELDAAAAGQFRAGAGTMM